MNGDINLSGLLPDFSTIGVYPETADQLSALFVFTLLVIFCIFLLLASYALIISVRRISWVNHLLKNETNISIISNREDLVEQANEVTHSGGHLWREFNATLIEVENNNHINLYSTLDANYFFNNSTLAAEITESRMLAAVPGFLTAFGVIGTFVGLQLGLSDLNIGNDVAVSEMKSGLAHVISGAKIAFMTSVWGVVLSVLFNFIEKFLEIIARNKIARLQVKIDQLTPRISAEFQLQKIVNDGQQSRESLQGLAEKIGDKMQESILGVVDGMQSSLESSLTNIMAPAINKLVDSTSDGNQKALESLVDNFLARFGEMGSSQKDSMELASQNVSEALGSLNSSMTSFLDRLDVSQGHSEDREKDLIATISEQVTQLVNHSVEQKIFLTEFVDNKLGGLSDLFQEREQITLERDQRRQEKFMEQSSVINASTDELLNRIEKGMDSQFTTSSLLIEQGKALQLDIGEVAKVNVEVSNGLKSSATELNSASQEIKQFGGHMNEAGQKLSGSISNAVESTSSLAHQNQRVSELMEAQRKQLIDDRQQFDLAAVQLQSLINSADSAFDKMRDHQSVFLNELKGNVSDLANQMTDLLSDYAKQANTQTERHLGAWAEHTTNYAQQMNSAAQTLSSVVDEMEDKLRR